MAQHSVTVRWTVAALLAAFAARAADVTINPEGSLLWSSTSASSVSIPIPWPSAAATATLTAPADGPFAGLNVALTKTTDSAYALTLPQPTAADEEYVVSLTLAFTDRNGEALLPATKAAFAVIRADAADFHGDDATAETWGQMDLDHSVVALPVGADSLELTRAGAAIAAKVVSPCRWAELLTNRSGAYEVSVFDVDGVTLGSAELVKIGKGLMLLFR